MAAEIKNTGERGYHDTKSAYTLPNDSIEHDRLDEQAVAIAEMLGGCPFLALQSLTKVSKVVDVGCGTGVATIQLADMFPSAKIYGLDISPVPEAMRKGAPANTSWVVGNILNADQDKPNNNDLMSREIFTPGGADYIFGRLLINGVNDWSRYFSIASRSLRSGGIIEHQDLDWYFYRVGTSTCLSDRWEWHQAVMSAFEQASLSARAGSEAQQILRGIGMEIVSVQTFEYSIVPSQKTPNSQAMGRHAQAKVLPLYQEMLRKMLQPRGITGEKLERYIKDCLHDVSSEEGIHLKYIVTVARKP